MLHLWTATGIPWASFQEGTKKGHLIFHRTWENVHLKCKAPPCLVLVMLDVFARMIESSVLHSTMQKSSVLGCTLLTHFQH